MPREVDTQATAADGIATPDAHITTTLTMRDADYFGVCPECHHTDGYLNVRKSHYGTCHKHKTCWSIGSGLFSSWQSENEAEWEKNSRLLDGYRKVEPLNAPSTKTPPSSTDVNYWFANGERWRNKGVPYPAQWTGQLTEDQQINVFAHSCVPATEVVCALRKLANYIAQQIPRKEASAPREQDPEIARRKY